MRLRVLVILGALLCLIAVILSVLLLRNISSTTTQDVQLSRLAAMNRFVQLASFTQNPADYSALQLEMDTYSEIFDEGLIINIGGKQLSSGNIDPLDPAVSGAIRAASINLEQTALPTISPFSETSEILARPFGNATQVLGSVILQANLDTARSTILRSWSIVVAATLSACAGMLLLADRLSTWVLRPVQQLIRAVTDLARTQKPSPLQEAGPPELRALARSFGEMAQSVSDSLTQQRELIAETSHQLRNPIAALRLRVDLMKLRLGEQTASSEVAAVEKELQRMESLIDSVLLLASAEHRVSEAQSISTHADFTQKSASIPAAEMLREEIERHTARASQVQAELVLVLHNNSDGEVFVYCNEYELQTMLEELIANALKYAPGKPIELALHPKSDSVEFTIRDHGPGLPPDELGMVTQRFWRAEATRQRPGTGLGTSIVDSLARANNGSLRIENAQGGGLRAILKLPRSRGKRIVDGRDVD
ncbi:HAMP domain-containing sensor histidine kinase [Glutamicibacter sp.]|uniref:sensor histidine kinase n=1 Tax=Glutamicibacter sp. TaxID=1931995 RepID=UPI0028BDDDA9|nr:HAMP domain-containing sensor histidine kinase [Glutamicibacter sp.]